MVGRMKPFLYAEAAVAVEYWAHLPEEAKALAGSDCNLVEMAAEQQFAVEGH